MKEYILNYYPKFKCVASECKHTCCALWQAYIDEASLEAYKKESSPFSTTLKKGIDFRHGKFKMKKGRCALLDEQGLCKIIKNLGEQSLCQVCRDHPRFRSFFSDRVETGLGFCCEEASRIILTFSEKITPVLVCDDERDEKLGFIEEKVLEFRGKALFAVQDRTININERIKNLLSLCLAKVTDSKTIIKFFRSLERLDKSWAEKLNSIDDKALISDTDEENALACEQFLVNYIYRYSSSAEDTALVRAHTLASVLAWWVVKAVARVSGDIIESARAYSAEVDYSHKNLARLFKFCGNFIKIGE